MAVASTVVRTLEEACGENPGWICRLTYEQTDSEVGAQIANTLFWIAIIALSGWLIARFVRRQLPRITASYIEQREALDAKVDRKVLTDEQKLERELHRERSRQRSQTLGTVLGSVLAGVVVFIAVLLILDRLGFNLAPLIAGAGIAGLAVGFGAQQMVKDFLAGGFIILEDQFGVGDVVDLGEAVGTVERVSLRVTRLRDVNGVVWYVPNGEIRRVGNLSKLWSRAVLDIDVSYDTDLDRAGQLLKREADALWRDGLEDCTIISEPEFWGVERFGADGITLRLVVRTEPTEQWTTARELRARIKRAFDEADIEIPFPQRTVWLKPDA